MTSFLRLLPAAAFTAAVLAAPAAAGAAQSVGSSLDESRGPAVSLPCDGCSFAVDQIDGLQTWTDPGVVTSFSARFDGVAKLRVYTREGDDRFVPTATSAAVSGDGTLQHYAVSVPVAANQTIGLAMHGTVAGIAGTGRIGVAATYGDGSAADSEFTDVEPLLRASVESDYDSDGLGDETQDDCVFCSPTPVDDGGGDPAPIREVLPPAGDSSRDTGAGGGTQRGGGPRSNENIRSRTIFTIQDTGLVVTGRKPVVTAYVYNGHNDAMTGTAQLRLGSKVVAKARVYASTIDDVEFKVTPKVARAIAKGAKATVSAKVASDEDGTESDSFAPKFVRSVAGTKYDGRYRAKGPVVIEVRNGVVTTTTTNLLAMSTQGSGSLMRAFYLPSGVPAVIGKDGRVEVHGHAGSDEVRLKAAFNKNGTITGYTSLWYYALGLSSSGSIQSKPYLGASNWTAKKVGK